MNGTHAIIELNGPLSEASSAELLALMEKAALTAGATIIGRNVHEFGGGFGHTGVLLLAESHISVHTWPENHYTAFDVFMCGESNIQRAIDVLIQDDRNESHFVKVIKRGRVNPEPLGLCALGKTIFASDLYLISRICDDLNCSAVFARSGITELAKFLQLASIEHLRPSPIIASIWQQLVLNTELYENFCQQYLNQFIHFRPEYLRHCSAQDLAKVLKLYEQRWGKPPQEFWSCDSKLALRHAKTSVIHPL